DDAEQQLTAELVGQQRCRRVRLARRRLNRVRPDQRGSAVPEHQREQVEDADHPDRPHDAAAGLLRRRHRVEAGQHVWQGGGGGDRGQGGAGEGGVGGGGGG